MQSETNPVLTESIDLLLLVDHQAAVLATESVEHVYKWFQKHPQEYVGVTSGTRLLGMVSRGQIGFLLGARFGFAVYARQPIQNYLMVQHLQVCQETPLLEVLQQALSRQGDSFYDDVAVVDAQDNYLGMISLPTLVRWQSKLIGEKTHLAQQQHVALQENNRRLFRSLNELRQSRARFEILFENSALGVALLNGRGEVETCNERLASLLGLPVPETTVPACDLTALVAAPDRAAFARLLLEHEAEPQNLTPRTAEFLLQLPGRGPRRFKFFTNWIRETGQICALLDDVTEQRVLEHRMIQKEKSAMLDSLVGGIAHEINNKLAPIVGYAELLIGQLQRMHETEKLAAFCTTIRDSAIESAKIIRQLLQLSRPMAIELSHCDVGKLVREVLDLLRFRIRECGCEVQLDFPAQAVLIPVDAGQIKQVIINLMLNALDAMEGAATRQLRLTLAQKEQQLVLSVADSGHGIRPEHLHRIFDPFFTTKGPERGSGLGLSVCLSIVKNHGGELTVESKPGSGSQFKVALPLANSKLLAGKTTPVGNGGPLLNLPDALRTACRSRVLVVDDEEFITNMVQEALRAHTACLVERVNSGQRAIARLQRVEFDLVISDVRMSDLDGFGLFEWVAKHQPELAAHFLFITGDAGSSDLNEKIESLGVPVLRKPFSVEQLLRECEHLAKKSSGSDQAVLRAEQCKALRAPGKTRDILPARS